MKQGRREELVGEIAHFLFVFADVGYGLDTDGVIGLVPHILSQIWYAP